MRRQFVDSIIPCFAEASQGKRRFVHAEEAGISDLHCATTA